VTLAKDLKEFIELLNARKVDFVIVGGHAVAFHGHPRYTGDLDFFVRPDETNARKILDAVTAFGFAALEISLEDLLRPNMVVQLGRVPNRIDLLTSISGVDFETAWTGKVAGHLGGVPVFFVGFDALVTNKEASGRDQDLADVRKLRAIRAKRSI